MSNGHNTDPPDEWGKYQRLVLAELRRLNGWCEKLDERWQDLDRRLVAIEARSALFGAAAGLVAAAVLRALWG